MRDEQGAPEIDRQNWIEMKFSLMTIATITVLLDWCDKIKKLKNIFYVTVLTGANFVGVSVFFEIKMTKWRVAHPPTAQLNHSDQEVNLLVSFSFSSSSSIRNGPRVTIRSSGCKFDDDASLRFLRSSEENIGLVKSPNRQVDWQAGSFKGFTFYA